jgi:hypothetical protein
MMLGVGLSITTVRPAALPSSLAGTEGFAAIEGQTVYAADVYADNNPLVITDGVRISQSRISHQNGRGIFGSGENIVISDVEVIHIALPEGVAPHSSEQENIHIHDAPGVRISRVKVSGGSSGIRLIRCPNAVVEQVQGENFFGPLPCGQLVQFDDCPGATLDGFSVVNDLSGSYVEDNISVYKSPNVEVRNGLVDGNNAPNGTGVMFEESDDGLCEDVLTAHMGNGAFTAAGSQNCTFRRCDTRDGHNTGQGGRAAPSSNGLSYGSTPDYYTDDGEVPASAGTVFEDCRYSNPANAANISFDNATISTNGISEGAVRERSPLNLIWPWQSTPPWEPSP